MSRAIAAQKKNRAVIIVISSAVVITAIVLTSIFGMQRTANATTSTTEYKKALAASLSVCMDSGAFKDEVTAKSFTGIWTGGVSAIVGSNAKKAYPAGYDGTTIKKGCQDIFKEALSIGGLSLSVSSGELSNIMEKIGYESTAPASAGKCMQLTYYIKDTESDMDYYDDTKAVCIEDIDENGVIKSTKPTIVANGGTGTVVAFTAKTGKVNIDCAVGVWGEGGCGDVSFTAGTTTWDEFKTAVWDKIKNSLKGVAGRANSGTFYFTYALDLDKGVTVTPYGDVTAKYVKKSDAAAIISKNLLGVTNYDFAKYETMSLYQTALVNYYKVSAIDPSKLSQDEIDIRLGDNATAGGYSETKVISNGEVVSCLVKPTQKSSSSIPAVGQNGVFGGFAKFNGAWGNTDAATIDFDGIVEWMKNNGAGTAGTGQFLAPNIECSEEHYTPTDPNPTPPGGGGSGGTNNDDGDNAEQISQCIEAAGALGWILCPVLDMASDATSALYSYIENNFLWIGSDVMGTGTKTNEAWKVFRNYANVAFIIMFLVVILSQITGFGISNYGIKKILPRLIAVALLTNLSFIVCQLAVDLSDILGSGLNTALSSIGGVADKAKDMSYGVDKIVNDARAALFGTGATAFFVGAVTWRLWLLPLLLAILGALVGVFMFFLSLAVREAGIIILVILCPVAIICYALPNTKKLFDKWFRMFTSLLMVYPICGLLMGGGQFASSILTTLGAEGDQRAMFAITAMLLSVVPFFFIPTIVRTSLNAIGQLGARISNFGRGMSGRMTGAIRGSEGFRNAQRTLAMQRDENTVRRLDRWGKVRKAVGLKEYSKSGQRRRSLAYARADKARKEDLIGRSYNGRKLLKDDKVREAQLLGNLAASDFDERVKGAKATFRDAPEMATEKAIVAKHDELLEKYGEDPNNIQLQTQLRALEEMAMEKGAPGQDLLQQSFARYATKNKNSWNASKGQAMSKLGAGLATRYGKELNGSDKGFNTMMNDFAEGDFSKLNSFKGNDTSGYRSSYDTKLAGFTAAGMNKATPGALQRGLEALQSGAFSSNNAQENNKLREQAQTLVTNATQALNDELIANDLKPAEKSFVQGIASYGASMPGHSGVITNLGQGSLENIAQFVDGTNDTNALMQLGRNIQEAAGSSHLYGEAETKRLKMIVNKINSKAGTSYTFNPASMQIDQSGSNSQGGQNSQQDIPEMFRVSDAERAQLEADAARNGRRIR